MGHWGDIPSLAHESDNSLLKLLLQGSGPEARKDTSLLVCAAYTCRSFARNPELPDSRVKKSSYSHVSVKAKCVDRHQATSLASNIVSKHALASVHMSLMVKGATC